MLGDVFGNSEIRLSYDALGAAAAGAEQGLGELEELCRRGEDEVARLLDGGWSGAAAAAFDDAWREWLTGAAAVRAGLGALAAGIRTSERLVRTTDEGATAASSSLLDRVVR